MINDPASLYMDQNNRRSENATRDQASYESKSASNLLNQDIKQALYQKNSNTIKDRNTMLQLSGKIHRNLIIGRKSYSLSLKLSKSNLYFID